MQPAFNEEVMNFILLGITGERFVHILNKQREECINFASSSGQIVERL